jgi:tetratricopeptide (TPR) repeat protein
MNVTEHNPHHAGVEHPSLDQLKAFVLDRLGDNDSTAVENHLAACDHCVALLETVPEDAVAVLFRQAQSLVLSETSEAVAPSHALRFVPGYTVLERLGEGGMGVVWKARQDGLNRLVAVKCLRSAGTASLEALARFRREAEAVARLHHPHIVQIHEIGEHNGEPYLTLEYVGGGNLAQKLAAGPMPPNQAAALVETLAHAIHHAHEHGIIHRDLKPANVLLDEDGASKISDFGLAKQLDEVNPPTQTGSILGTPSYMAPEQTECEQTTLGRAGKPDPRLADVYALGAILYETLTGRPPFRGPTVLDTLAQVREREPVPPRQLQPSVPRDLQTICLKCLHKEPRRRYGSAFELADDLRRFSAGEPIRARPVGCLERLRKWMRRKPYQALLVFLAMLSPPAVVAGLMWHNRQLQGQIRRAETAEETERENYRQARQTIRRMIERLDQWKPANVPEVSRFMEAMLQEGLAYVETLLNASTHPGSEVRADAAGLLNYIGMLQVYYGRPDEARASLTRAVLLWQELAAEQPNNIGYRRAALTCYRGLASIARDDRQALASWDKVLALAEELCHLNPDDDLDRPTDLAQAHHLLACFLTPAPRNGLGDAEPHYQRAIELMERVIAQHPEQSGCRSGLADSYCNLGFLYSVTSRPAQAEELFRRADALLETLMRDDPQHLIYPISRAAVAQNWGNLAVNAGRHEEGISLLDRAVGWSEAVLRKEPSLAMARSVALNSHGSLAEAYESAGRFQAALPHWDRVITLASGPGQLNYRFRRAQARIKAGDSTQAAADADSLAAEPSCPADMLYNCACVFALTGRAEKAIFLLNKLRVGGYFDKAETLKNLHTDKDLDSLRRRDDFAKLIK